MPVSLLAEEEQLYCVSLRGMTQAERAQVARILHQCKDMVLVAASKDAEARLAHPVPHFGLEKGYRALRLNRIRPAGPFTSPPSLALGRGTTGVKIQSMVSQVSATHLQNTVQDLENMGERKAGSGAHNAETYLVNAFNVMGGLNVSIHDFDPFILHPR